MIRYYSAAPQQTAWTKLGDGALIVSLLAALPVTWFFDGSLIRPDVVHHLSGSLQLKPDDTFVAFLSHPQYGAKDSDVPAGQFWGFFAVNVDRRAHGFPLITSYRMGRPIVELTSTPDRQGDPQPERHMGSAVQTAIAAALQQSTLDDARTIRAVWAEERIITERNYLAWTTSTFLWWVALFVGMSILILLARFGFILFTRNHAARMAALAAAGKCQHCAYDLRGLEFSERCPECGSLQE